MSSKKVVVWDKDGNRTEKEKASPWLPPEQMRGLPSDYYTKNPSDPDRVHEDDAPHIVEALVADRDKKYQEPEKKKGLDAVEGAAKDYRTLPFTQENIDWCRFAILNNRVKGAMKQIQAGYAQEVDLSVNHVWFPDASFNEVLMREGNAPADSERPKHLKGKELFLDVRNWPSTVKEAMLKKGIELPNIVALLAKTKKITDFDIPVDQLPLEGLPE